MIVPYSAGMFPSVATAPGFDSVCLKNGHHSCGIGSVVELVHSVVELVHCSLVVVHVGDCTLPAPGSVELVTCGVWLIVHFADLMK